MPMPPSVNSLYCNVPKVGRCKTQKYKAYELECFRWKMLNMSQVLRADAIALKVGRSGPSMWCLSLRHYFFFPRKQLYTLKGDLKANDTSNRIKAHEDILSKLLRVDDRYFWSQSTSKAVTTQEHGYVDVTLELIEI
jgi:hypothetical protein